MPFILVTGVPCSCKTTRTAELKQYFEEQGKEVHVVSENDQIKKAGFDKNSFYADSDKEKHIRGLLKSEVMKLISPNNVVILDALNYIKGCRYELFCATKANKCTQCTVHAEINRDQAWTFNENRTNDEDKYDRATFDALLMRYEEPDGRNRWDAPLFMIFPDQTLDKDAIYASLFKKKLPKPNMATQNPPLSSTNFLYDLDQTTKIIVDSLIKIKSSGVTGEVAVPDYPDLKIDISKVDIQNLMILRRQYLIYSKMHTPDSKDVPKLFVHFLCTNLK